MSNRKHTPGSAARSAFDRALLVRFLLLLIVVIASISAFRYETSDHTANQDGGGVRGAESPDQDFLLGDPSNERIDSANAAPVLVKHHVIDAPPAELSSTQEEIPEAFEPEFPEFGPEEASGDYEPDVFPEND